MPITRWLSSRVGIAETRVGESGTLRIGFGRILLILLFGLFPALLEPEVQMFAFLLSDESWLNGANALLGICTVVAILAVGGAIFHDVSVKIRERAKLRRFAMDDHAFATPELGFTMADGGEPEEKKQ